jgi:mevalonate kinase
MIVIASAPAKAILLGEHSVNRGQSALAVSVGLRVRCTLAMSDEAVYRFASERQHQTATADEIGQLTREVDAWREAQNYEAIRHLSRTDFFASAKYILGHAFDGHMPAGLSVRWESEIPSAGGLGSGGTSFAALATALAKVRGQPAHVGQWAYLGDVIAHGGVASALDTQTSLHGGVIRYTREAWGAPIPFDRGLSLVIGNTRMRGQTSEVNTRVRQWLEADATRLRYFEMIGVLSRAALEPLAHGDWPQLGALMNLNQLVLERIGVSSPELEVLCQAALGAGAFGAKLSGSGGGGIMLALVAPQTKVAVAEAIQQAGGEVLLPDVAVDGARVEQVIGS